MMGLGGILFTKAAPSDRISVMLWSGRWSVNKSCNVFLREGLYYAVVWAVVCFRRPQQSG